MEWQPYTVAQNLVCSSSHFLNAWLVTWHVFEALFYAENSQSIACACVLTFHTQVNSILGPWKLTFWETVSRWIFKNCIFNFYVWTGRNWGFSETMRQTPTFTFWLGLISVWSIIRKCSCKVWVMSYDRIWGCTLTDWLLDRLYSQCPLVSF